MKAKAKTKIPIFNKLFFVFSDRYHIVNDPRTKRGIVIKSIKRGYKILPNKARARNGPKNHKNKNNFSLINFFPPNRNETKITARNGRVEYSESQLTKPFQLPVKYCRGCRIHSLTGYTKI